MLKKLVFLLFVVKIVTSIEVRTKTGQSINTNIIEGETLASLREKLQSKRFPSSAAEFWFLNSKNKTISQSDEESMVISQNRNVIIIEIKTNTVKVCLNGDLNLCTNVNRTRDMNLKNVRNEMIRNGFIDDNDASCHDWRFFDLNGKINRTENGISVKQAFIRDKTTESDLNLDNFIVDNNYVFMIDFINVNLENVYVKKWLTISKIFINPQVNLNWLRQVLSGSVKCANSLWKGTERPIFDPENKEEIWRIVVHSDGSNKVNSDSILGIAQETESTINSKAFMDELGQKSIEYTNVKAKKPNLIGSICEDFKHQNLYSISVFEKYPKDVKSSPVMLSYIRNPKEMNQTYYNVVLAENGTAIVLRVEHAKNRKMYIQIKLNDSLITWGVKHYFTEAGATHEDIVLTDNVFMSDGDDFKQKLQNISIVISTLKKYTNSMGRYEWNGQNEEFFPSSLPEKCDQGNGSGCEKYYWDYKYDDETEFNFKILNFLNYSVAQNLIAPA